MEFKSALKILEEKKEFKEWKKENKETYLSYGFNVIKEKVSKEWNIGYYNSSTDKMTTFVIDKNQIKILPDEEVFKKEGTKVNKIDESKVKLNIKNILEAADKLRDEKYPTEIVNEKIIILQNLEDYGSIWNITYITKSFNTINMKINSEDGKVIEHKMQSVFSFRGE